MKTTTIGQKKRSAWINIGRAFFPSFNEKNEKVRNLLKSGETQKIIILKVKQTNKVMPKCQLWKTLYLLMLVSCLSYKQLAPQRKLRLV